MTPTVMNLVRATMADPTTDGMDRREKIVNTAKDLKPIAEMGAYGSAIVTTALGVAFIINPTFFLGAFVLSAGFTALGLRETSTILKNIENHSNGWFFQRIPSTFTKESFAEKILKNTYTKPVLKPIFAFLLDIELPEQNN